MQTFVFNHPEFSITVPLLKGEDSVDGVERVTQILIDLIDRTRDQQDSQFAQKAPTIAEFITHLT